MNKEIAKKTIDWEGKGDISQEIHAYAKERLDYWQEALEENKNNEKFQGIVAALKSIVEFIEH